LSLHKVHGAEVQILESLPAVAADAADMFVRLAREAGARGEPFRVALSGGSTPRLLYGLLASDTYRDSVDWSNVRFFFGDERWVAHTHRESNYKMANDELLRKLEIDRDQVHPMPTERVSPDEAAEGYAETLRQEFGTGEGGVPEFSLVLLGMGDDGHTASLFPHTDVLREREKWVAAPYIEKLASHRLTLTPPVLQAAREVLFLVAGAGKAPALREVLEGKENIEEYPSQLLRKARGRVTWMVDVPAAAQLSYSRNGTES
jgi:6-phosphogluconolactonase